MTAIRHGDIRCKGEYQLLEIDALTPHPKNPNRHTDEQIRVYAAVLAYQGVRQPVRVSRQSKFVTKGHGQLLASRLNDWTHVPVEFQDYDSEEQEYADLVADNALAKQSDIDYGAVNGEVGNLGPDFDIAVLGIPNFTVEPAERLPPPPPSGGLADPSAPPSGNDSAVTKVILFYTQDQYLRLVERANEVCARRGFHNLSEAFAKLIEEALAH